MAYASTIDEEQNKQQPGQAPSLSTGIGTGGISTGQGTAGSAQTPAPQDRGGNQFPDISRYLTQNQPGAERLAAQYAGNVTAAGNQARNDLGNVQSGFNQQVQQNTVPLNPGLTLQAANNPTSFFNYPPSTQANPPTPQPLGPISMIQPGQHGNRGNQNNFIQPPNFTATATPGQNNPAHPGTTYTPVNFQSQVPAPTAPPTVADQAKYNQLQNMLNAKYAGPTDLTSQAGFGTAQQEATNAANLGAGTATDQGRLDMLRNIYGGQGSTPGVANLDNLLLQGQKPTNILRGVAGNNVSLPGDVTAANTAAQGQAQQAAATDTATSQAVRDALQGTYSNFDKDYQNRLQTAQAAAKAAAAGQGLPHRPGAGDVAGNIQRAGYQLPTNVATNEDYQKLQALNQLMGSNYGL